MKYAQGLLALFPEFLILIVRGGFPCLLSYHPGFTPLVLELALVHEPFVLTVFTVSPIFIDHEARYVYPHPNASLIQFASNMYEANGISDEFVCGLSVMTGGL